MPNYSMEDLDARVQAAKHKKAAYITECLDIYKQRSGVRKGVGIPVLCFVGNGRAGKDTSAEIFAKFAGVQYGQSTSAIVLPIVAEVVGEDQAIVYAERHQHREFWIAVCHAIRGDDLTLLARMNLSRGDVIVGVRGKEELLAVRDDSIADLVVWVGNNRVPADITTEFREDDCDISVQNNGSLEELSRKLRRLYGVISGELSIKETRA